MFKRRRTPFSSITRHSSAIPPREQVPDNKRTVRLRLDLGGGANGLRGRQTALGVNQVGCEDSVDQSRFSKTSLA
jgi:hypothetical protein